MSWWRIGVFAVQSLLQLGATYTPIIGPFANWFYTPLDILLSGILTWW